MKTHHVDVVLRVTADSPESILEHVEQVAEQLADLDEANPEIASWDFGLNAGTGELEIGVDVLAEYEADAIGVAYGAIRTAIHAAGGRTPNWSPSGADASLPYYEDAANAVSVFA